MVLRRALLQSTLWFPSKGAAHAPNRPRRSHPGQERPGARARPACDQEGDGRQARQADRGGREEEGPAAVPAGDLLRALFLRRAGDALVPPHRARAGRADRDADAQAREEAPDGDRGADLRGGTARRLLQHGRGHRRRRPLSRQVQEDPHPALQAGLLGEVLLPARQPRLSGVRDRLREGGRLHLLRPPLPGGRAGARPRGGRDRLQPLGDGGGPLGVPLGARAAGARGRERLLRGRHQSRRHRAAVEDGGVLRQELFLRPARQDRGPGPTRQGRDRRGRPQPRHDRRVRSVWQFYRDRRPDAYGPLVAP